MALTRKMLKAMGIEDEKIDQIIEAHSDTVDALKEERDNYKKDAERLPGVQSELDTLKAANTGDNSFEAKYNALKTEYDGYKAKQAEKETTANKDKAYRKLLADAGVSAKRVDAIMRVTDLASLKLAKDGTLEDADKALENIKKEWADFIVKEGKKGADTETPPENNGGKMTKDDILKIKDTAERQKAMAENHELFGF